MDIDPQQAAEIGNIVVKHRAEIDAGDPYSAGPIDAATLHAIASGAANTYALGELIVAMDRADDSTAFLRELLAKVFAHGFKTGVDWHS